VLVGRCHASKCGERGPHQPASQCHFDTAGQSTKHAQASGQGNATNFDFEKQTILAQRAAEDALELLAAEKTKSADLLQANRELENGVGQLPMKLDMSRDEKVDLHEELTEAYRDLEVRREWATLAAGAREAPRRTLTRGASRDKGPRFG
jgi:hypothetical protein